MLNDDTNDIDITPIHEERPDLPRRVPQPQNQPLPSSSSAGFFQKPPDVANQFHDDIAIQRGLGLFLPKHIREEISPELSAFGSKVLSPKVLSWVLDAERDPPYVKQFDTWGRRRDELITSEGWRNLQALGIAEGMVAIGYENDHAEYSRIHHFAKYALWCGSAAWVNCPSLMVDGVAALFRKHLSDPQLSLDERNILRSAYDRLTSRDPEVAWTTGQWMTERQGGSDVSMTETLATYSPDPSPRVKAADGHGLGPWLIDGFKWFSSATDANMMVMLARTPKGISTFFAPMRRRLEQRDVLGNDTELNGVRIQRLKNKLGTRALPTAELELQGVRAWLVGEDGKGTKEIATVLNIARIHNGVTAIGLWGRGLGIVRAFTRGRVVGRRPLWERTAFMQTLAHMHVEYRANVLFNLFVAGLLGVDEQKDIATFTGTRLSGGHLGQVPGLRDAPMAKHLLRLLTPALKGHCSKTAILGLQECMECMGGVGYLENEDMQYNVARLYRDANVMPIWEGTTNMMADDSVLRVLFGKTKGDVLAAFEAWIQAILSQVGTSKVTRAHAKVVETWWQSLKEIAMRAAREEAEMKCRTIMDLLVNILQGALLLVDAVRDDDEVALLVVYSWFRAKTPGALLEQRQWEEQIVADQRIVFGRSMVVDPKPRL
ncbi:Acyl-CoA dehydrogenase family member 11 [Elsinoe australis]|uniref:Acyl-CoA dehydrogenase family member 11 n=1 Tax=Elsinoe australis TaxID=40998 RepID=A0A2P7Z0Q7_9PEZI|nr:Acyl-CoA dehydrogenase family member 11 [Elsinoe australis]